MTVIIPLTMGLILLILFALYGNMKFPLIIIFSVLCRWGRGVTSYNGSSENLANPSYRHFARNDQVPFVDVVATLDAHAGPPGRLRLR